MAWLDRAQSMPRGTIALVRVVLTSHPDRRRIGLALEEPVTARRETDDMPFELVWEPRGVRRRYFGKVSIEERQRSFDLICSDPRFDDLRYAITDYLDVDDYEISRPATEEIAARHVAPSQTNPHIAIAAVVVDPRIVEEIKHFIELRFTDQPYQIFADELAARAWIAEQLTNPDQWWSFRRG